jgi:hypothetical protein
MRSNPDFRVMLGLTAMKDQTELPLATDPVETPFTTVVKPERASTIQPFTLTPPPIPWDELDRRHKAAATEQRP